MSDRRVVVLDNGGGSIKIGFAGDAEPICVAPNCSAKPKGEQRLAVADEVAALRDQAALSLRRPVDRGFVVNPHLQRDIWDRLFRKVLKINPSECSLLVTEPLFNLPSLMGSLDELVFEHFGFRSAVVAPAACFVPMDPLLYGNAGVADDDDGGGRCRRARAGLVLDCGFSATQAVPVFDGRVLWPGVRRLNLGGKALTNHLKELISFRTMNVMDEFTLVERVKERVCFVSTDFEASLRAARGPRAANPLYCEYVLPDGVALTRGFVRGGPDDPRAADRPRLASAARAAAAAAAAAEDAGDGDAGGGGGGGGRRPARAAAAAAAAAPPPPDGDGGGDDEGGLLGGAAGEQWLPLCAERFLVPEALLRPSALGSPQAGLAEAAAAAAAAAASAADDPGLAALLWGGVALVGGGAALLGLRERLEAELRPLAPAGAGGGGGALLRVRCPPRPGESAWRGAAAWAAGPGFAAAALGRRDWAATGGTGRAHPLPGAAPPLAGRLC